MNSSAVTKSDRHGRALIIQFTAAGFVELQRVIRQTITEIT
jgi:hypothetical protein